MEYISLGIFIVLIAQFLFYVKKKNEILFNKIKNIFLVKEIAVPLFYFLWRMGYTVLEFRLNIKEYFLLFILQKKLNSNLHLSEFIFIRS